MQLQRLSVSGMSFCGTDIGGFTGEPDGELYTRWMQFGVFSPFMRVHSAGDTRDREPWSFGPEWEAICKKFIELRYKLLPYIYTAFWQQHRYGDPILRPIAVLEQHLAKTYSGGGILFWRPFIGVAGVTSGAAEQNCVLACGRLVLLFQQPVFCGRSGASN